MTEATELRPGTPQDAGLEPARMDRVRDLCNTWVKDGIHPALGVLVARHGVIALQETYGVLGPEDDAPQVPHDAIWWVASQTKLFTATAVMQLVEDGLVGLTRPVQEYIPEFAGPGKEAVCVHHLLTHTSGLNDDELPEHIERVLPILELPPLEETQHLFPQIVLAAGLDWPLYRPPGEEMCYANFNFDLLGEIVRRVSGVSLTEFAKRRIFDPLGMKDTSYGLSDERAPRMVRQSPDGLPPFFARMMASRMYQEAPFAFGGGYSTLTDMAVFAQTFLNGGTYGSARILSEFAAREMTRDQIPGLGARMAQFVSAEASWGYGFGVTGKRKWDFFPTTPVGSFAHSGGSGAYLWGDPTNHIVGLFFAMCSYGDVTPGHFDIKIQGDLFVNAVMSAVL